MLCLYKFTHLANAKAPVTASFLKSPLIIVGLKIRLHLVRPGMACLPTLRGKEVLNDKNACGNRDMYVLEPRKALDESL